MTDTLNKFLQIGLFVVLTVSLILFALFYINGESMTDTIMYWAYILFFITVALLLAFPIIYFINNPKQGVKFLITLVGFVALYGISYALASDSANTPIYEKNEISANVSRMIGAGMIMTYIVGGIALVGLVFAGISKVFK
jgi:uncharacterized protein (DUF58 family)